MEPLLSAAQVAEILGVHVNWIYAQAKKGLLPSLMVGRQRRFRRLEIERWLDQQAAA